MRSYRAYLWGDLMPFKPKSKCSITLPFELYADIDLVASVLGISKSALVVSLLREAVSDMATLGREVKRLGYYPDVSSLKRLRGKSVDLVAAKLEAFNKAVSDLDREITSASIGEAASSVLSSGGEVPPGV